METRFRMKCAANIFIVGGSFILFFISMGTAKSFGIIYTELLHYFGASKLDTSWIPSIGSGLILSFGPFAGMLEEKFGCRTVSIMGSILTGIGLAASSFVTEMDLLYLTYGVITGIGFSLCHVAANVSVNIYFAKKRALAVGISSAGSGIGTAVLPLLVSYLLNEYGWQGTFLILSGIGLQGCYCGLLFRNLGTSSSRSIEDGSEQTDQIINRGDFDYLFGSPELLVGDHCFREELQLFEASMIVVDEFHTIACWGERDEEDRQAFRKWFSYIGELRSIFPSASLLALSATCTQKISRRVKKSLNLKETTMEIRISPDNPNIKLVVKKVANSVESSFAWLIDDMSTMPKTIVYCISIRDVAKLYSYLLSENPDCKSYCDMYHSETTDGKKTKILDDLCSENGSLRIVIATSALGMRIDLVRTNSVILYGAPCQIVDVIQQIGRVGRDGSQSVAILLYNSYHLRNVEKEVKQLFTEDTCRRKSLLKPFLTEIELNSMPSLSAQHFCCDICTKKCKCDECDKYLMPIEQMFYSICNVNGDVSDEFDESDYFYNDVQ